MTSFIVPEHVKFTVGEVGSDDFQLYTDHESEPLYMIEFVCGLSYHDQQYSVKETCKKIVYDDSGDVVSEDVVTTPLWVNYYAVPEVEQVINDMEQQEWEDWY